MQNVINAFESIRIDEILINSGCPIDKAAGLCADNRHNPHHKSANDGCEGKNHNHHTGTAFNAETLKFTNNGVKPKRDEDSASDPADKRADIGKSVVSQQGQTNTNRRQETERYRIMQR